MKRLTFPHIATERHPNATGKRVALSLRSRLLKPDKKDVEVAREILEIHANLKHAAATGEWKWVNANKRSAYLRLLEKGNAMDLAKCLAYMFRNDAVYGIISSDFSKIATKKGQLNLENQILLDIDTLEEFDESEQKNVEWNQRSRNHGNPYGYVTRDNKLISVDTARHVYYANKI